MRIKKNNFNFHIFETNYLCAYSHDLNVFAKHTGDHIAYIKIIVLPPQSAMNETSSYCGNSVDTSLKPHCKKGMKREKSSF